MANPNTADIRQHLTSAYSDEEITVLCADYFRDVSDNFAAGMNKGQKIQLLLDHCQRRELIPNLLAALQKDRPEQYRKRFGAVVVEAGPPPAPRERDPRQVFISHAHEDAEFAHRLATDLQAHGWRTWLAPDSIRPGEKWVDAISRGLEESGVFILVLTPAAVQSPWVKSETNAAIASEHQKELRLIPIEVVVCRAPMLWNTYQHIPFAGRYSEGLTTLLVELDGGGAQYAPSKPAAPLQPLLETVKAEVRPAAEAHAAPPDLLTITSPIYLELVRVAAGEFLMGSDLARDKLGNKDEMPQHRVYVPEYYIGKYPVTNEQYAVFVQAAGHRAPYHWASGQIPANKGNHPVVNVDWKDAAAFCEWLRQATGQPIHLPTEAEWEKAARGDDGRIYPWGDQSPDQTLCNFNGYIGGDTTPVGQYPKGASPYGVLDLSGNVWEWTASLYHPYPYRPDDGRNAAAADGERVVRGGSFFNVEWHRRCAVRNGGNPNYRHRDNGFRVVASPLHS